MTAMNTFRDEAMQNGDTTTWLYEDATGVLTNKVYADGKGPHYTYTPDCKLATRTWARTVPGTGLACQTLYAYNSSGQLTGIDYSDTTPDVAFTYDRLGHQLSAIAAGVSTNLYAYSRYGQLTNEVVQGLCAASLSRATDSLGRSAGLSVAGVGDPGSPYAVQYGYDTYGRFDSVSSAGNTYTYSYLPGANTVSGMTASSGHAWTRSYEPNRNLISAVTNRYGSTVISAFDYANDEIGRRTAISRSGTAFDTPVRDAYGYNARSEVTSSRRTLAYTPSQEVRGFSYDYAYDPIGNRTSSTEYDHEDSALVSSYTANALNQYSQRSVPGYAGVRGSATNNATVTVNGNTAWRLGKYFYGGDDVENSASADMKELDITAVVNPPGTNTPDIVESVTGKVFVAKSPEAFTYDDDGNMLGDGRFVYTWDGENRLASIETSAAAASAGVPRVRVEYSYDHRFRRIGKESYFWDTSHWSLATSHSFLYDGWNMIRELQYSNIPSFHSSTNSYVWGLDLSGSLQGAGGVGGLLAVAQDGTLYNPAFDGNGNVCEYSSTDGTLAAHYEYSPFGETVIQSGDTADSFAFRFSTKYWEHKGELYYYGYRYYMPRVGLWLSRDPMGETFGCSLYNGHINSALNYVDWLGAFAMWVTPPRISISLPDQVRQYEEERKRREEKDEAIISAYNCLLKELLKFFPEFVKDPTKFSTSNRWTNMSASDTENMENAIAYWDSYIEPFADYYFERGFDSASSWTIADLPKGYDGLNPGVLLIDSDVFYNTTQPITAISTLIHEPEHNLKRLGLDHIDNWGEKTTVALGRAEGYAKSAEYSPTYCCSDTRKVVTTYWDHFLCKCKLPPLP